jgi:hypothetical protein
MKGDFSRLTFDRENHYAGVRWQQGRPVTDADENEAHEIAAYRVETETIDVIGQAGAPRANPGFALSIDANDDLLIGPGRLYVDGILCENDAPVAYPAQPDLPEPPEIVSLLKEAPLGLVYLEVFKRHLSYHDHDGMRDPALNGVDTTTRLQTVWQVRVAPLPSLKIDPAVLDQLVDLVNKIIDLTGQIEKTTDPAEREKLIHQRDDLQRELEDLAGTNGIDCDAVYPEWGTATAPPSGLLEVVTDPGTAPEEPCDVPLPGGYQRGENQFYRVEVHSVPGGGGRNGATFKWSRDNGSIAARILAVGSATSGQVSGTVFAVDSVQRDDYLGIHNEDWVEYVDDTGDLTGQPGPLARVLVADKNLNTITLDRSLTVDLDARPKLRKWDQTGASATDTGLAMNAADGVFVPIEGGIQVSFSDGTYRHGDYWQFDARAVTGLVSFPATAQPPEGVQRHYARLGLVALHEEQLHLLLDCRAIFPPLTAITASDVGFDNTRCDLPGVRTVQEAIDALCARPSGAGGPDTCVVIGKEGRFQDLQQAIDTLRAEGLRRICLCLMPGEVLTVGDLFVEADRKDPLSLAIHGCVGTQIEMRGPWQFLGLAALELLDLDITVPELVQNTGFFTVANTAEFTLAGCRISAFGQTALGLIQLSDVDQVLLRDNRLTFASAGGLKTGTTIFKGLDDIVRLFDPAQETFLDERAARLAAGPLAGLDAAARKRLVTQARRALDQAGDSITPAGRNAYLAFSEELGANPPRARVLIERLKAVLQAVPGTQVVLMVTDCDGDVTFENNRFLGLVCLGGFPDFTPLPASELMVLVERLKGRQIQIVPGGGRFHADANSFTGLVWSNAAWKMLQEQAENPQAAIDNVYAVSNLSDNLFNGAYNQVAGIWLNVTGNTFRGADHPVVLAALSQISAISGNTGPLVQGDASPNVFNYASVTQQAANPGLVIVSTN